MDTSSHPFPQMLTRTEERLLEALPFILSVLYVFLAPFNKVEESFHLQVRLIKRRTLGKAQALENLALLPFVTLFSHTLPP
jgi:hypothetical protein